MIDELRVTKHKWEKDFKNLTYSNKNVKKQTIP